MNVLILQHTRLNPAGIYADLVRERGASITVVELDEGEPIPSVSSFDAVIAMGGPMSVNDEDRYPWLVAEKHAIREAVEAGMPFWGACLGAQLLASSMGGRVYRMPRPEIGFLPIDLTDQARTDRVFGGIKTPFAGFQWHDDAFELPDRAVRLGCSKASVNQVFRWGEYAYGLQCHLEATVEMVRRWTEGRANRTSLEQTLGVGASERLLDELEGHESEQRDNARNLAGRWLDEI